MTAIWFITRGIKDRVDALVNDLQAQVFTFNVKNKKTKKVETHYVQGALRPVQLWEYVVPDEHVPTMVKTLDLTINGYPKYKKYLTILRKMLKLDKIKEPSKDTPRRILRKDHVAMHVIGVKKDAIGTTLDPNIEHELL